MDSLKTKKSFTFSKGKEIVKEKEIKFQITNNQNTADTTNNNYKKQEQDLIEKNDRRTKSYKPRIIKENKTEINTEKLPEKNEKKETEQKNFIFSRYRKSQKSEPKIEVTPNEIKSLDQKHIKNNTFSKYLKNNNQKNQLNNEEYSPIKKEKTTIFFRYRHNKISKDKNPETENDIQIKKQKQEKKNEVSKYYQKRYFTYNKTDKKNEPEIETTKTNNKKHSTYKKNEKNNNIETVTEPKTTTYYSKYLKNHYFKEKESEPQIQQKTKKQNVEYNAKNINVKYIINKYCNEKFEEPETKKEIKKKNYFTENNNNKFHKYYYNQQESESVDTNEEPKSRNNNYKMKYNTQNKPDIQKQKEKIAKSYSKYLGLNTSPTDNNYQSSKLDTEYLEEIEYTKPLYSKYRLRFSKNKENQQTEKKESPMKVIKLEKTQTKKNPKEKVKELEKETKISNNVTEQPKKNFKFYQWSIDKYKKEAKKSFENKNLSIEEKNMGKNFHQKRVYSTDNSKYDNIEDNENDIIPRFAIKKRFHLTLNYLRTILSEDDDEFPEVVIKTEVSNDNTPFEMNKPTKKKKIIKKTEQKISVKKKPSLEEIEEIDNQTNIKGKRRTYKSFRKK